MEEEVKKDVKWMLVASLVLLLGSPFIYVYVSFGFPLDYQPKILFTHLRNISTLSFIITVLLATLYIADFWRREPLYIATTISFIVSMLLFFTSCMQWIPYLLE